MRGNDNSLTLLQFPGDEIAAEAPCVFIDANDSRMHADVLGLPPCALIAIGDRHGVAARLADAVVSDRKSAATMQASIAANPKAAAVTVELLRLLPSLSLADGLVTESLAYAVLQGSEEHAKWLADQKVPAAMDPPGRVHTSRNGNALNIVMNRPDANNAIDVAMRDGLAEALQLASIDDEITEVHLSSRGRSFSLGAELSEFGTTRDPAVAHAIRRQTLPAIWAAQCGEKMEVHVQGACVGAGLELAAFARRVTASPRAWFQLPELAMGLLPGAGGCVSLTRRIGRQRTAELVLSGKRLSAREALDWGLIDAIVDGFAADDGGSDLG